MEDLDKVKGGRRGAEPPAEIIEFSEDEMTSMDESVEIEKKPARPKKKVTEKQKEKGLENLKKGREILALKRKEQRELRERQKKEKEELKQRKDFTKKDEVKEEPIKEEPIKEPIKEKRSVKEYVDEIEEHIQKKPKKKRIIYREESDSEEEIVVKRKPKQKIVEQEEVIIPQVPKIKFFY
jgi:hypothetical protein